jgi:hypothetical protein
MGSALDCRAVRTALVSRGRLSPLCCAWTGCRGRGAGIKIKTALFRCAGEVAAEDTDYAERVVDKLLGQNLGALER